MLSKRWFRPGMWIVGGMFLMAMNQPGRADDEGGTRTIRWHSSYAKAAKEAASTGQPLLIEFTASWCAACQQMQQLTFRDERVIRNVQAGFVPLVLDADQNSDLVRGFRVEAFPTTIVVSPELKIVKRLTGYQSSATLLSQLDKVVQDKLIARETVQPASAISPANGFQAAFDGFCLVSILDDRKVRRGEAQFTTTYLDQVVWFHSKEHLEKFLANPERYWPVANGKCLVTERDAHQETVGDPRMAVTWRGKLWLFSDRESQQRFIQSPRKYVSEDM